MTVKDSKKSKNIEKIDQTVINELKKELHSRKDQILKDLEDIAENNNDKPRAKFPDFGDKIDENAQEIGEYSTNLATEKVLENTLRDIDNALNRIEKGTYGTCKYCGKHISKKRLQARPVASACIECKTTLQNTI
ncbi:TraR/DksA family transcriptional regulator [Patescibacteria group bacterium]